MASQLFQSLAATAFAAMLFHFFLKRRSRAITGREPNKDAAANDGIEGGASGAHPSTEVPEMATSSGANKDAAADDGTARGDSGTRTSTEVSEMATSSGANKDAAANDGIAGGASGAHTSTEGQGMDTSSGANKDAAANDGMGTSSGYDYEVFLSFRGPDTRSAITDFLYTSLTDAGIRTFKDDEELRVGEEFAPALLQAINQSKISIPIFSKGYASSAWCLKELVQMVECQKDGRQKIMPIFYDVAPSEVRHQTGGYGEALRSHEKKGRYSKEIISQWKAALSAVLAINGWDLHSKKENRREGEFARKVTQEVFNELKKAYLVVSDCLVSVDNHVDAIMEMIGVGTNETRIIGIHGMGGIGKTTIAKIIYNKLSHDFENCCFLRDIRETSTGKGIQYLQNQLISDIRKMKCMDIKDTDEGTQIIKDRLSNKRVLLLLDDVEEENHIDALGKRDCFDKGSKIIITTRKKDILYVPKVNCTYELSGMDPDRSLQLFSKHAFRRDSPFNEYIDQSNRAIKIVGGLPLALEVIGSLLSRTEKKKWNDILEKLDNVPHAEVQRKLRISYDALEVRHKHIFLDIACFFIGYNKNIVVHFWEKSKYFPKEAMQVLQNMSLIKINEDNEVRMHDQLRDLGREMVRQESNTKIEKQSRVWDPEEGLHLLKRHKVYKEVEALRLNLDHEGQYRFTYEGFESLSDLRFFEVSGSMEKFHAEDRLLWHESPSNVLPTDENLDLLRQLRWLSWSRIPQTFNIANFSMEDLAILNLSESEITDDWKGWSHMKVMRNLKVLDLSSCRNLQSLPDEVGRDLASLEYLSLKECEQLERLPDSIGNLELLIELDISRTRIAKLPESIEKLKNLKKVKMWDCGISEIPDAFWTIEKLEEIQASNKSYGSKGLHVKIGNGISKNQSLRILRLENAEIYALPSKLPESLIHLQLSTLCMDMFPDLSNLTNLKELDLRFSRSYDNEECNGLMEEEDWIPRWIGNLSKLKSLHLYSHHVTTVPIDISSFLPQLKSLSLSCPNLRLLPKLPSSLSILSLQYCSSLCSVEDLSNLKNLSCLFISKAAIAEIPGLGCLENLRVLNLTSLGQLETLRGLPSSLSSLLLSDCSSLCSMEDLSNLKNLSFLFISKAAIAEIPDLGCLENLRVLSLTSLGQLETLRGLPSSLSSLQLRDCSSLCSMGDLSNLKNLSSLSITKAAIVEISGLGCLENLRKLNLTSLRQLETLRGLPSSLSSLLLYDCSSLCSMEDLSNLKNLSSLSITKAVIAEIPGLGCLENLQNLWLASLGQVEILPGNLNKLRSLHVSYCGNLVEIQGKLPQSLEELSISLCESLQELPNLSSLKGLRKVEINRCKKLNVEAISSLCLEKSVEFYGRSR